MEQMVRGPDAPSLWLARLQFGGPAQERMYRKLAQLTLIRGIGTGWMLEVVVETSVAGRGG